MGRRVYQAQNNTTTFTSVVEIVAVRSGALNGLQLHWLQATAGGVTTPIQLALTLNRKFGTTTSLGTGTAGTPLPVDDQDGTAKSTVQFFATAASTGTSTANLKAFQWNLLLPFDYMPGPEDEDRDAIGVAELLALATASISGASAISTFATWREYP
jgi:hypothetical protein